MRRVLIMRTSGYICEDPFSIFIIINSVLKLKDSSENVWLASQDEREGPRTLSSFISPDPPAAEGSRVGEDKDRRM